MEHLWSDLPPWMQFSGIGIALVLLWIIPTVLERFRLLFQGPVQLGRALSIDLVRQEERIRAIQEDIREIKHELVRLSGRIEYHERSRLPGQG